MAHFNEGRELVALGLSARRWACASKHLLQRLAIVGEEVFQERLEVARQLDLEWEEATALRNLRNSARFQRECARANAESCSASEASDLSDYW